MKTLSEEMHGLQIYFLDIDGTLVDFQGKLADSALKALETAKSNGHKLFVCTGRQRSQIYPWLLEKWISTARYARLAHMLWQTASA